jgi:hypothetical protein
MYYVKSEVIKETATERWATADECRGKLDLPALTMGEAAFMPSLV